MSHIVPSRMLKEQFAHNRKWLGETLRQAMSIVEMRTATFQDIALTNRKTARDYLLGKKGLPYFAYVRVCNYFQINPLGIGLHITQTHYEKIKAGMQSHVLLNLLKEHEDKLTHMDVILLHACLMSLPITLHKSFVRTIVGVTESGLATKLTPYQLPQEEQGLFETVSATPNWRSQLQTHFLIRSQSSNLTFEQIAQDCRLPELQVAKLLHGKIEHVPYTIYKKLCNRLACNPFNIRLDLNQALIRHIMQGHTFDEVSRKYGMDGPTYHGLRKLAPIEFLIDYLLDVKPEQRFTVFFK